MKILCTWLALASLAWSASVTHAEVKTREIDYTQGETPLQGTLAWNDAIKGKRPGVLVVHEWWGHNAHARRQAERLARAGYVAFALDMYGKGKVTTHPDEAQAFVAEATKDPAVMATRFEAARQQLVQDPHVDSTRIAAIGYCFGGAVVLGIARSGADLKAVATFHGALATRHVWHVCPRDHAVQAPEVGFELVEQVQPLPRRRFVAHVVGGPCEAVDGGQVPPVPARKEAQGDREVLGRCLGARLTADRRGRGARGSRGAAFVCSCRVRGHIPIPA